MSRISVITGSGECPASGSVCQSLPDGTVLGNDRYVYQGKAVFLSDLKDGQILSNGKIAYQGMECDLNLIPTGLILSNATVVVRDDTDFQPVVINGKVFHQFEQSGRCVPYDHLPDGFRLFLSGGIRQYKFEGNMVPLGQLPDGIVLVEGTRILGFSLGGECNAGETMLSGYPLRDGRVWLSGFGPVDSLSRIPDGTRLYNGKIAWEGQSLDPGKVPDGAVIFIDGVPNSDDPPDWVMSGGIPVEFQALPDMFQLLDGRYVLTGPDGKKAAVPVANLPDFTILPGGKVVYHGVAYSLMDLVMTIENEMIQKEDDTFQQYYYSVSDRNQKIQMINDWLNNIAGRSDYNDHNIYFGEFTFTPADPTQPPVTKLFRDWMDDFGLEKLWKSSQINDYDEPGKPSRGGAKFDKGGIATMRESLNAKIKEFSSDNEMDMIFLNQANNEKSSRYQQMVQLASKYLEMMSGAAAAIKS